MMIKNNQHNEPGKFGFSGLIILEMANNHQGSVEHGKKIISELAPVISRAGVRAAMKFQLRKVDSFIHPDYREKSDNKHIPRFISTSLTDEQLGELVQFARAHGFTTMASPFDEDSVDLIDKLGIEVIKVASASAADWPLLKKVAQANKPVVCSTGGLMSEQIDNLASYFTHRGVHFAFMHCVPIYPTPDHKLNLVTIQQLKERYPEITIGFSTHEDPDNVDAVKVAYAMGARLFERHVGVETKDIKLNKYSSTPAQVDKWLEAYSKVISMTGMDYDSTKRRDPDEAESIAQQTRGIYLKNSVKAGQELKESDVFFAIPLQPRQLTSGQWTSGMIADRDYKAGEPVPSILLPNTFSKGKIIYKVIHDARALLNIARVAINYDSNVTLYHPDGLDKFSSLGAFVIDCFSPSYSKRIFLMLPGQDYPKHYNKKKIKTLQVMWGKLVVTIEGRKRDLHPGDTVFIPNGVWHSFSTQSGAIFEEIASMATGHDDVVYSVQKFATMQLEDRETQLVGWGRHQFDDSNESAHVKSSQAAKSAVKDEPQSDTQPS